MVSGMLHLSADRLLYFRHRCWSIKEGHEGRQSLSVHVPKHIVNFRLVTAIVTKSPVNFYYSMFISLTQPEDRPAVDSSLNHWVIFAKYATTFSTS